jgi:hypothetical protein
MTAKAIALVVTLAVSATANPQETTATQFRAPAGPQAMSVGILQHAVAPVRP